MSPKSSTDPRVRRSRLWLQGALKALVQERDYETITVLDLAARAEVNRTTFYQHFRDKDELLDSIISDLLEPLLLESDEYFADGQAIRPDRTPPMLVRLFERVGAEVGFYRRMFPPSGSPLFISRMVTMLENGIAPRVATTPGSALPPGMPQALAARFLALGLVGSLSWWLEQADPPSPQQAADWSWQLTWRVGASG